MSDKSIPDAKTIGLRIKRLREAMGLSQENLAKKIGTSPSAIAMYEIGERIPRDEYKKRMSLVFDATIDSIFFDV